MSGRTEEAETRELLALLPPLRIAVSAPGGYRRGAKVPVQPKTSRLRAWLRALRAKLARR